MIYQRRDGSVTVNWDPEDTERAKQAIVNALGDDPDVPDVPGTVSEFEDNLSPARLNREQARRVQDEYHALADDSGTA